MSDQPPISRRDLPAVVRRAAELASIDDDADEQIPEEEVVRIAAELGLAERHVRQALFEGVREAVEPGLLDRHFGTPRIVATRAVPLDPVRARRAIEDYMVTSEYLQIVRRTGDAVTFEPAVDTVSKVARNFQRSSKHLLASAVGIEVSVRELEAGWSHVRLRALYEDNRRAVVTRGAIGAVLLGGPLAAVTSVVIAGISSQWLIPEAAVALGSVSGIAAFGGIVAAQIQSVRNRYRSWRQRTQNQADALLDRLEKGDELRPPPAPWVRKLQMKFGRL